MPISTDDKVSVQLRLGKGLVDRINKAARKAGISRNTWIVEATGRRLAYAQHNRFRTSATELMAQRVAVMIRVPPLAVNMIDEAAAEAKVNRTVWITDACLAAIQRLSKY
jgi:predicted HicB family RNase H-like nuclease